MRGSETGGSGLHVTSLRSLGLLSPRSSQTDPTYPVIQSWSPNPRKKEQAICLVKSSPHVSPLFHPSSPPLLPTLAFNLDHSRRSTLWETWRDGGGIGKCPVRGPIASTHWTSCDDPIS